MDQTRFHFFELVRLSADVNDLTYSNVSSPQQTYRLFSTRLPSHIGALRSGMKFIFTVHVAGGFNQREVDLLMVQCDTLLVRENEYRARLAELHNERSELVEQVQFAKRAAADLEKDYQFATDICIEYFSVFHPAIFSTESPTLLALGWGVVATWWIVPFLGCLLAIAARGGSRTLLAWNELVLPIAKLLATMGVLAALAGLIGFVLTTRGTVAPPTLIAIVLPQARHARFMADWWVHNASYFVGFFGSIALCIVTFHRRQFRTRP